MDEEDAWIDGYALRQRVIHDLKGLGYSNAKIAKALRIKKGYLERVLRPDPPWMALIDVFDTNMRTLNILLKNGIKSRADLMKKGRDHFVGLRGVGNKTLAEIDRLIAERE